MGSPDDMTDSGAGEVRITPSKVYETVMGMKDSMAKIESLLETHIAVEGQSRATIETRLENHGTRLGNNDTRLTIIESEQVLQRAENERIWAELGRFNAERASEKAGRAPWWNKIGAIVGIVTGVSSAFALLVVLNQISTSLSSQ